MRKILFGIAILLLIVSAGYTENKEESLPSLDAFGKALQQLVLSYYPEAEFTIEEQSISFEYDTRIFMIHYSTKMGEWQDAVETKGPNKNGVLGDIRLVGGKYKGAAEVPQTFDECYFKFLLLAPWSSKYDCHLQARLYYPKNTSQEFINSFTKMVNNFESFFE